MPMRSGLSVYCYTAPTSGYYAQTVMEIGSLITDLSFASAAPGGFTTFSATLTLRDGRIPLPPLGLFGMIAVMNGPDPVWLGEVTDPEMGMDSTNGEYIRIGALGLGNALRDDPMVLAYAAQTVQQIVKDQLARRTNGSPYNKFATISTDTRYIFPDNPAGTYSPVYDNNTMEEVIAAACTLAGDYQWGTWAHPLASQINGSGFRLGVLSVQLRDANTTHYAASVAERDVTAYNVTPSAERAYNNVVLDYNTPTGGVATKSYLDPRLNQTSYAQGTAPFRYRKLSRDYTGTATVGATQAQNIANTYGNLYKNVSNKVDLTLQRIKDAYGNPIPLWSVLADHNILIRDFAPRGNAPIASAPTATVNQFYIVNAEYREDMSGTQEIELQCDNFVDKAASQIARLTLAADVASRTQKTSGFVQAQGAAASGYAAMGQTNPTSGQVVTAGMQWPVQLYQAPTSVSFTQLVRTNLNTPSAANLSTLGGIVQASVSASANCQGAWTYSTSGNCIRRIGRKYLDWHCDGCGKEFRGLSINEHVRVVTHIGTTPGLVALAIDCPECAGFTESFNTGLRGVDEEHETHPHRREQARLIRRLMRHGAVGLEALP